MTSRGFILGVVVAAMGNFGCKSELAMPGGVNSIGGGTTLTPLTNAASASDIRSGKKVYDSDGNVITGILATQSLEPNSTAVPAGYYSVTSLDSVDSDLVSSNIKSGVTIFGVTGTSAAGDFISSMAPRKVPATFPSTSPTNTFASRLTTAVASRTSASLSQEATGATNFQDNNNLVPDPRYDNDGRFAATGGTADSHHYLTTIFGGRPSASCGTSGTIDERITDCFNTNLLSGSTTVSSAFYDGKKYGQNGEGDWRLVTRLSTGQEVWRDERTQFLWSDRLSSSYNWCQAAGFARNSSTLGFMTQECGVGFGSSIQTNPPTSACANEEDLEASTFNGLSNYQTPNHSLQKGNLGFSSTPKVTWRLPTIHDWTLAEMNGIRKVLPNMDFNFWSSTSRTNGGLLSQAWYFGGATGFIDYASHSNASLYSIRCIGR